MYQTFTLDAVAFFKEVRDLYKETGRRIKEISEDTGRKFRLSEVFRGRQKRSFATRTHSHFLNYLKY
ncbi:MAG: hypothetical protein HQK63_16520 [Desulfamplus sp.]|nr:hypothetical protein [Desulfamplus sp.]